MTPWQKWCLLHGAFLFGLKAAAFVGTLLAVYVIWWNVVMVSPTPTHLAQEGQTITITLENDHVYLTCGATPTALDEMIRWASSNDFDEVKRVVENTGSSLLYTGDQVKVLDRGFSKSKVRVLRNDTECWVPSEAINR